MIGFIFGSFFSVVAVRIPRGLSISWPRSHCPFCKRTLRMTHLIPVFSYVFQKGRCSHCKQPISIMYPCTELITGALFASAFLIFGVSTQLLFSIVVISLCIIVVLTDLLYLRIPNKIVVFFGLIFLVYRLFIEPLSPWYDPLLTAFLCFLFLFAVLALSGGGIGGGDVKLFMILALALGSSMFILVFFLSTLFGTMTGIVRKGKTKHYPLAPSISVAVLLTLFAYDWVWEGMDRALSFIVSYSLY
ncbi:A24 family peptidase [Geomicrobium sp. JSM 1781026]|uniref:prepilin peptidase n=1 Tax=Geomicrobium sp. JSM 1781026 TaxID=3344580 RepID=UPI0035BF86C5